MSPRSVRVGTGWSPFGDDDLVAPVARDLDSWLRELWELAVEPTERRWASAGGSP